MCLSWSETTWFDTRPLPMAAGHPDRLVDTDALGAPPIRWR
jgi:hypothetical protein